MASPDSPIDPVSPSPTTPSSGSPPPDEDMLIEPVNVMEHMTERISAQGGQGKRRLPSGTMASPSRDAKTRRRDEAGGKRLGGGGASGWTESRLSEAPTKSQREELIDMDLVERLRVEFGDPFDDNESEFQIKNNI